MDEKRFDALATAFAATVPRRRFAAALAALLGGLAWPTAAQAGCTKAGKTCDTSKECCDGARCRNGKCWCKGAYEECDGRCYKLKSDEKHCGRCDRKCGPGERCRNGTCRGSAGGGGTCPAGADSCAGDGTIPCGGSGQSCACVQTSENQTVCVNAGLTAVLLCASSADCQDQLGRDDVYCGVCSTRPMFCLSACGGEPIVP